MDMEYLHWLTSMTFLFWWIFFFQIKLVAGAIAVAGVGGIIYNDNLNNVNRLNDDIAKANARIKALESSTALSALATRVSAVESSSSSSTSGIATLSTKIASNCAKVKELTDAADATALLAVAAPTC